MRIILPVLFIAMAFGGFSALKKFNRKKPPKPPEKSIQAVETLELQPETLEIPIYSQGTVEAVTSGNLNMQVTGRIIYTGKAFRLGGRFKKGEVLIKVDPTDYQAAKAHADAMLARAKLAHLEEKVRSAQARQEWETTNGKDNNKEPSPLVLRLPQLQLAEAELFSAEKAAELAEANLQRTELLAPYDGVLTEKLADLGQVVSGGPGVPVARAYSTDSLEVMLPVSSREIDFVDFPSQPAATITANIGGKVWSWNARIDRNTGQVNRGTRLHHLVAVIETSGGEPNKPNLQPGQFVNATIVGKKLDGIFRVPRQAFVSEKELYLVTPVNTLLRREVNITYRLPDALLVDEGLTAGDTLNLTRLQFMNDGLEVRRSTANSQTSKVDTNP